MEDPAAAESGEEHRALVRHARAEIRRHVVKFIQEQA
jgi:hypothetical protein